ncbi:hypothetical protein F383_05870 [Gossypium arboreum]|uniref:Uncharacterized protein n=1 Tax=Gossypium arboreum TaxID=29729 RepID=A0A0B0PHZ9_GOSAR|nr:hypothetical protein F383_05870 [Gossypium arboreum]
MPMPCPRHSPTLALIYRCRCHVPDMVLLWLANQSRCHVPDRSYTDTHQADTMSQTGLTLACISQG